MNMRIYMCVCVRVGVCEGVCVCTFRVSCGQSIPHSRFLAHGADDNGLVPCVPSSCDEPRYAARIRGPVILYSVVKIRRHAAVRWKRTVDNSQLIQTQLQEKHIQTEDEMLEAKDSEKWRAIVQDPSLILISV